MSDFFVLSLQHEQGVLKIDFAHTREAAVHIPESRPNLVGNDALQTMTFLNGNAYSAPDVMGMVASAQPLSTNFISDVSAMSKLQVLASPDDYPPRPPRLHLVDAASSNNTMQVASVMVIPDGDPPRPPR